MIVVSEVMVSVEGSASFPNSLLWCCLVMGVIRDVAEPGGDDFVLSILVGIYNLNISNIGNCPARQPHKQPH